MCFWRDLVVLIWKITRLYSTCRSGCIGVGPLLFRTPASHDIVLSVAVSVWLQDVPLFLFFDALDGSLSTRYEKVYGFVHIKEPKTRRTTGQADQQHVLL